MSTNKVLTFFCYFLGGENCISFKKIPIDSYIIPTISSIMAYVFKVKLHGILKMNIPNVTFFILSASCERKFVNTHGFTE